MDTASHSAPCPEPTRGFWAVASRLTVPQVWWGQGCPSDHESRSYQQLLQEAESILGSQMEVRMSQARVKLGSSTSSGLPGTCTPQWPLGPSSSITPVLSTSVRLPSIHRCLNASLLHPVISDGTLHILNQLLPGLQAHITSSRWCDFSGTCLGGDLPQCGHWAMCPCCAPPPHVVCRCPVFPSCCPSLALHRVSLFSFSVLFTQHL